MYISIEIPIVPAAVFCHYAATERRALRARRLRALIHLLNIRVNALFSELFHNFCPLTEQFVELRGALIFLREQLIELGGVA